MEIEVAPPADGCAPVGEAGLVPALLNSGEVYRQHVVAVRRALLRLGVRDAELEDATQDVFIVLLRRLGDYDGQHAAKHWLMGIARRVASTYRRSARRRGAFMNRFSEHPLSPRTDTPDAHMERTHVSEVVTEFLDGLDPDKCAVFVLSEIKGLSGPEISDVLGEKNRRSHKRHSVRSEHDLQIVAKDKLLTTGNMINLSRGGIL